MSDKNTNQSKNAYKEIEKEYTNMTIDLYKYFAKFIMIGPVAIVVGGGIRALIGGDYLVSLPLLSLLILGIPALKYLWARKEIHAIGITVFYIIIITVGFIIRNSDKKEFATVFETFYSSYTFCIAERLMVENMPNIKHKIASSFFTLAVRLIVLPKVETPTYIKHFWMCGLSIFVAIYREKSNGEFLYSYINSREQLTKFKNLVVENIPEAIAIVSQDLKKSHFLNTTFLELVKNSEPTIKDQLRSFYLKEEHILEKFSSDTSIASPTLSETLYDFIENCSSIDRASCIVSSYKTKMLSDIIRNEEDNRRCLFEVKLSKIIWDDYPCIAVILHDITEHHTILSLKIADAQKDKVLATVSHELKTPLNGMLGMIQVMEKKIRDPELLRFLKVCKDSTTLLVSLVCSILDLNQLRADKMRLKPENVDIQDLLKEVVSLFEYQCQQKKIYLRTQVDPDIASFLYTDKDRLSQVLINIIGNAQKFTSKGGILITARKGDRSNSVKFIIEDTGVGISQRDQVKLFQIYGKFNQEDERINRQGVGLGLTIAENLVKALNNNIKQESREIRVESEQDRGSAFSFTVRPIYERKSVNSTEYDTGALPTIPNEKDDPFEMREPYNSPQREHIRSTSYSSPLSKQKLSTDQLHFSPIRQKIEARSPWILLVDDNLFNIVAAEQLVLSHGYRVKTALSGSDAIDILAKNNHVTDQIILILMDCQMPIMDGYETTRILRQMMQSKKVPTIPIVALTANDTEEDKQACRKVGMNGHLSKPLKDEELKKLLKKYC